MGVEIIRGVRQAARKHRVGVVLPEFGPQGNAIRYWIDDALDRTGPRTRLRRKARTDRT